MSRTKRKKKERKSGSTVIVNVGTGGGSAGGSKGGKSNEKRMRSYGRAPAFRRDNFSNNPHYFQNALLAQELRKISANNQMPLGVTYGQNASDGIVLGAATHVPVPTRTDPTIARQLSAQNVRQPSTISRARAGGPVPPFDLNAAQNPVTPPRPTRNPPDTAFTLNPAFTAETWSPIQMPRDSEEIARGLANVRRSMLAESAPWSPLTDMLTSRVRSRQTLADDEEDSRRLLHTTQTLDDIRRAIDNTFS